MIIVFCWWNIEWKIQMHLTRNVSESGFVIKDFKNPEELPHTDPPGRYHLMSFASSSRSSADTRPESQTSQKFGPEMKKNQLSIVSKTNHHHYPPESILTVLDRCLSSPEDCLHDTTPASFFHQSWPRPYSCCQATLWSLTPLQQGQQ